MNLFSHLKQFFNPQITKILLVDDNILFLKVLQRTLLKTLKNENEIYHIITAETSNETIDVISKDNINTVIMDFNLGGDNISGYELIKVLKLKTPKSNIIILTNLYDVNVAKKCYSLGADKFICKSEDFDSEIIETLINKIKL
jgi:DNA-binding NarL/FixJ family response regulator